ncbi:MAG TPA: hypothetical protein VNT29_02000 [Candidatus Limnocylindrales bacterium]|nr:hypothetical protein [Candidatus Limnocylindrales bacterium]
MIVMYLVVLIAIVGGLLYLLVGTQTQPPPTQRQMRLAELGRIMFACAMFAICFHYAAMLVKL